MTIRGYQEPAVQAIAQAKRGIVKAPAGSGKTIIAAAALNQWAKPRFALSRRPMRVAWIANTTEQVSQAITAMAHFPALAATCQITTACYAASLPLAFFDLVILDECHHIAAPEFRKGLTLHTGWRWGFSATPTRADDLAQDVFTLIGPIVHTVERTALVEAGQLAKARVIIHQPNTPNEMDREIAAAAKPLYEERRRKFPICFRTEKDCKEQMGRCVWQVAQQIAIKDNQARNRAILQIAAEHAADSHLVLVGSIEHGEMLCEKIPGAMMVFSRMGAKKRREAIAAFGNGELRTMIATSLADEGLDVPRANVLTLAAAGKSAAKAEQRTGRVLRTFHDKTHGLIFDFDDVQHYYLKSQSRKRIALYESLGYAVTYEG
jgi:superfamily II DNA or RNA helicase